MLAERRGAAFLAAGFLAAGFLAAAFLGAAFLAAGFLAAAFFGAAFLADDFLAVGMWPPSSRLRSDERHRSAAIITNDPSAVNSIC
jgi:hypothetical protein